jgi:hypothetical protein
MAEVCDKAGAWFAVLLFQVRQLEGVRTMLRLCAICRKNLLLAAVGSNSSASLLNIPQSSSQSDSGFT